MQIIPAIDLRRGRCVRLYQGDPERETVYGDDPVEVARQWEQLGAKMLHLVDLDGAFTGVTLNAEVICAISEELRVPIQLGGGMRSGDAVEKAFSAGVGRVILGTLAVADPLLAETLVGLYGERVIVGIDARKGMVAVKGWLETSSLSLLELASRVEEWGVREIVYTDIDRDGALTGPDLKGLEDILEHTALQVILSGGISSLDDLATLQPYKERLTGVIVGKALYANQFTLGEAMAVLQSL